MNVKELSVLAYANGYTVWNYREKVNTKDKILEKNYFEDIVNILNEGDFIHICIFKENKFIDYIGVVVSKIDINENIVEVKMVKGV